MHCTRLVMAAIAVAAAAAAQEPAPHGISAATAATAVAELAATRIFYERDDGIWTCDGNGKDDHRWSRAGVKFHSQLALAPDATRFAMLTQGLQIVTADEPTALVSHIPGWGTPIWSSDGTALAVGTDERQVGTGALWLVQGLPDPGEPQRLTPVGSYAASPSFSPDGRWLAFANELSQEIVSGHDTILVERKSRVEVRELATGKRRIACDRTGDIIAVAWSPDGRHLAFHIDNELCVVPMAGGEPGPMRVLTDRVRHSGTLVWSDDGSALLVDRTLRPRDMGSVNKDRGEDALLFVPLRGETAEIALDGGVYGADFGPGPDWIAVTCNDTNLYRVHVPTGKFELLHEGSDHWAQVWWRAAR